MDNIEFNSSRNTHSFFSRKEVAWHGLGQVVQEAKTPEEVLHLANLDFEVALKPIYTSYIPDGCIVKGSEPYLEAYEKGTGSFAGYLKKKGELVSTNKSVCRMDNYTTLGIVGNKYTPVQNKDSIDFIYNILKNNPDIKNREDIVIETAGVLGVGERIFVTAKLPAGFTVGEEKEGTELYVVFTNSHNGTSSLTAMVTPIRVVCANTLAAAMGNNASKVKFRHTANVQQAMLEGMKLLNISYKNMDANKQLYNSLLNIKVDSQLVKDLINRSMLNDNQLDQVMKLGLNGVSQECISTRTKNVLLDMEEYIDMGCGQQYNRGTAYWAYMGMNSYLNNGVTFKDKESKLDNFIDGTSAKNDYKILEQFKLLV